MTANDEQLIHQIVRQLETAWNAADSAAFAAPFAEDADFVNVMGEHHQGRANIEAGHRQMFDTIFKASRVTYTVEGIRSVRPDVAVAFVRARLSSRLAVAADDPNRASRIGEGMQEDHARPTLVLAKDGVKWQIVAFQNTRIAQGPPDRPR